MERILRRIAGFVCMGLFVFVEVIDSFEVFRRSIPESIRGHITQPVALAVCLVGIVFLYLGFKGESESQIPSTPLPPQPIEIKSNPVISPSFNPIINIGHPLPQPGAPEVIPPRAGRKELAHNVQFVRTNQYQSRLGGESRLVAIYENIPIPNQSVRPFSGVKAKIEYIDHETRTTIMVVVPAGWADRDAAEVYMGAGEPFLVTLAAFIDSKWNAVEITANRLHWDAIGREERFHPLPSGDLIAVVTLIGDHGLSIKPEHFQLRIQTDRTAYVRHVEPDILA